MEVQSVMPKHLGNQRVLDLQTLTHGETRPHALRDGEIPYITRTQSQSDLLSPLCRCSLSACVPCVPPPGGVSESGGGTRGGAPLLYSGECRFRRGVCAWVRGRAAHLNNKHARAVHGGRAELRRPANQNHRTQHPHHTQGEGAELLEFEGNLCARAGKMVYLQVKWESPEYTVARQQGNMAAKMRSC